MSLSRWRLRSDGQRCFLHGNAEPDYQAADGAQEKAKPNADPTTMTVRMNGTKDRHLA